MRSSLAESTLPFVPTDDSSSNGRCVLFPLPFGRKKSGREDEKILRQMHGRPSVGYLTLTWTSNVVRGSPFHTQDSINQARQESRHRLRLFTGKSTMRDHVNLSNIKRSSNNPKIPRSMKRSIRQQIRCTVAYTTGYGLISNLVEPVVGRHL